MAEREFVPFSGAGHRLGAQGQIIPSVPARPTPAAMAGEPDDLGAVHGGNVDEIVDVDIQGNEVPPGSPLDPFIDKLTLVTENLQALENMQVVVAAWIEKIGESKWYDKIRDACQDLHNEILKYAITMNNTDFNRDNIESILEETRTAREKYGKEMGTLKVHVKNAVGELLDGEAKQDSAVEEVDVKALFPKTARGKPNKKQNLKKEETETPAADGEATTTPASTRTRTKSTGSNAVLKRRPAAAVMKRPSKKQDRKKDDDSDDHPLTDSLFKAPEGDAQTEAEEETSKSD